MTITVDMIARMREKEEKGETLSDFDQGMFVAESIFNQRKQDDREIFRAVSDDMILGKYNPLGNFNNKAWL